MRKRLFLFVMALFLAVASQGLVAAGKVLLIVKDGSEDIDFMLTREVGVMMNMLRTADYQPIVATESGKELGYKVHLTPDYRLSDVVVDDYVGIMVPCMGFGVGNGIADQGVQLLKVACKKQLIIAAQNGGVEFLQRAGILKGKHFSMWNGLQYIAPDAIYAGNGVTTDENLVTSGTCPMRATSDWPDTTVALTKEFLRVLGNR